MKRFLIAAAAIITTAGSAFAFGESTLEANKEIQELRIEQGRYNGQVTKREYRELKTEQARIDAMEARAKADGHISRREYNKIHDAQLDAYRHIKQDTTNNKVSYLRRWLYNHR